MSSRNTDSIERVTLKRGNISAAGAHTSKHAVVPGRLHWYQAADLCGFGSIAAVHSETADKSGEIVFGCVGIALGGLH